MDITEPHRPPDLAQFLLAAPDWADDLEFPRNKDLPRDPDLNA
ncbi:hypothetical protein [Spongiactinospora rosea]|nr:hypothetical protein [Spongiactinospora rosea]